MSDFIDLGVKPSTKSDSPVKAASKVYYPSLHISGVDGLDLKDGDEVLIKGVVASCTSSSRDGKTTYSCEVEARELSPDDSSGSGDAGDGLDSALNKISKKKQETVQEEDDEEASGMDDDAEEADETD